MRVFDYSISITLKTNLIITPEMVRQALATMELLTEHNTDTIFMVPCIKVENHSVC